MEVAARKTILSPGDMLGCYRIENFLGQGGFGVTYLALDTKLELQVAIKEYMPEQIAERTHDNSVQPKSPDEHTTFSWGLSRFIKEARTLAKFKHPNIVRVMAVFEQNGTAYMVMEYERGQDVKGLLANSKLRSEHELKKLIGPVIDGLAEVHRHGYIHRDIKPANILVRHDGSPVLLDFGSARLATGAQTQALTALVSVGYAPLEQYNEANDNQQGPWTDVYALGAVLYFAITGNPPIDSTLRGSAVLNDRPDPLTPLATLSPEGFTSAFCQAIDWALSFKIKDRPQDLETWRTRLLHDDATVLMPAPQTFAHASRDIPDSPPALFTPDPAPSPTSDSSRRNTGQRKKLVDPDGLDFQSPSPSQPHHAIRQPTEPDHDWESISERAQRETALAKANATTETTPSNTVRNSLIIVILATLLLVPLMLFKDRWLPESADAQQLAGSAVKAEAQAQAQAEAQAEAQAKAEAEQAAIDAAQIAAREAEEQRVKEAELAAIALQEEARKVAAAEADRLKQAELAARLAREEKAAQDAQAAATQAALLQAQRAAERAAAQEQLRREQAKADVAKALEEQQEREALASAAEVIASLPPSDTASEPDIDPSQPITDSDISKVLQQFNALRSAIARKDAAQLRGLTLESERKYAYFDYVFSSFDSIDITLRGIQASRLDQTVRAELRVTRMKRSNGDIAFPPEEFKTIPISSVRTSDWSKIQW